MNNGIQYMRSPTVMGDTLLCIVYSIADYLLNFPGEEILFFANL